MGAEKKMNCTFVCGGDDFLVEREVKRLYELRAKAGNEGEFTHEVIDGRANNAGDIEGVVNKVRMGAQVMSLFGENKLIWLKGVNFFGDVPVGKSETAKALIEDLQGIIAKMPGSVHLMIAASPVDRRTKVYKWFEANTEFHYLESGADYSGITSAIDSEAKRLGISFSEGAKEIFLNKVGGQVRTAMQELEKLAVYMGEEGSVEAETVMELVPDCAEGDFFEPVEAFFSGDVVWALDSIKKYFFNNNDARPLLSSFQGRVRLLIQLKTLLDAKELQLDYRGNLDKKAFEGAKKRYEKTFSGSDEKSAYNVFSQNMWYLGKLGAACSKFNLKALIDFQLAFTEVFEALADNVLDAEVIFEDLVMRCLGKKNARS